MSNIKEFKPQQIEIREDKTNSIKPGVYKVDGATKASNVREHVMKPIKKKGDGDYSFTKKNYGPLAVTDPDRKRTNTRDTQFKLSSILRDPLSIDKEEKRAIQELVQGEVAALKEQVSKSAYDQGYAEGLKTGHEEARKAFQAEGQRRLESLEALIDGMENAKIEILRQNERFILEMMAQISRMVLLKETKQDPEYLVRLSQEIIEKVGVKDNIRIKINPQDSETMGMLRDKIKEKIAGLQNLQLEPSDKVAEGGCIVETEFSTVDARIEVQLKRIHDSLLSQGSSV